SEQARTVAAAITGQPRSHAALPWFWSDQYDLKLQSVGLAVQPFTTVVRASSESPRQICVLYLREDVLIAADVVNSSSDFAIAKRLIASGKPVDLETIQDPAVSLKTLLSTATAAA
ncbi:MAG: oxidoreductase C-terminal domain-containing protein, partial [Mycetocola sp.]